MYSINISFKRKEDIAAFVVSLLDAGITMPNVEFVDDGLKVSTPLDVQPKTPERLFSSPAVGLQEPTDKERKRPKKRGPKATSKRWTEHEDAYIVKHYGNKSLRKIASDLSRTESAAMQRATYLRGIRMLPVKSLRPRRASTAKVIPIADKNGKLNRTVFRTTPTVYSK